MKRAKKVRPDKGDLHVAAAVLQRDSQHSHPHASSGVGSQEDLQSYQNGSNDIGFSSVAESGWRCAVAPGRFTQDSQHKIEGIGHCFGFLIHVIILKFNGVEKSP